MWANSQYDILKFNELKKYSIENYYIYIENLEAEKQRQEKMNKKGLGYRKNTNKV